MKIILLLIGISCFSGCFSKKDSIKSFIPGVYVTEEKGPFSTLKDTLIISPISKEGNGYTITRKVSFQRIRKGKVLPVERKEEQWMGIYNESDKVLYEETKGLIFSFAPEKNNMLLGKSEYKKVSEPSNR